MPPCRSDTPGVTKRSGAPARKRPSAGLPAVVQGSTTPRGEIRFPSTFLPPSGYSPGRGGGPGQTPVVAESRRSVTAAVNASWSRSFCSERRRRTRRSRDRTRGNLTCIRRSRPRLRPSRGALHPPRRGRHGERTRGPDYGDTPIWMGQFHMQKGTIDGERGHEFGGSRAGG